MGTEGKQRVTSRYVPDPRWHVSATSVCGTRHETSGAPCQDASFWSVAENGILLAAVADGAGSGTHGDTGAQIASQAAVEALKAEPDLNKRLHEDPAAFEPILANALDAALRAVKNGARTQGVKPRELASTLITIIATPHLVAAGQIGDGAAVIQSRNEGMVALTTPDTGEYINQTTFLISPGALKTAQLHIWHGQITHLAIFSDGLQMLALQMPFGKPHAPFFYPLFQFISRAGDTAQSQLTSFLQSPRVRERADDDLTLLVAALTDDTHAIEDRI
jgi:hypothetical protein